MSMMHSGLGLGLVRITIAAPRRRIDVALPEQAPLAELLPRLLAHAGEGVADDGEKHGGWALRRADGAVLSAGRTLAANGVRDGEVLHLVPQRTAWPELDYDDVVDAIATGARAYGPTWSGPATRRTALVCTGLALLLGLVAVARGGPTWLGPGLAGLGLAALLLLAGVVLSRALSDGRAGAALAAFALPYAFLGGLLCLADKPNPVGAPEVLLGSVALLVTSVGAYLGVADVPRVFSAGIFTGLIGLFAALLGLWLGAAGAAALAVSVVLGLGTAFPLLAMRLGKLPVPAVPANLADVDLSAPLPTRVKVFAAVARADELLTGLLLGAGVVSLVGVAVLLVRGGVSGFILAVVVSLAYLLRARLFPGVRQRLPLLATGVGGLALVTVGVLAVADPLARLLVVLVALVAVAGLVCAAGLAYSGRSPSPYLGRAADILDVVLTISVVPIACSVLGLYALVRGLSG